MFSKLGNSGRILTLIYFQDFQSTSSWRRCGAVGFVVSEKMTSLENVERYLIKFDAFS
jgi:hypothetical protein